MVQTCRTELSKDQTQVRSAHTGRCEAKLSLCLKKVWFAYDKEISSPQ